MLNRVVIAYAGNFDQVFFLMRQISYEIGFHYKKTTLDYDEYTISYAKKNIVWFFAIYFSYSLYSRCVCLYEWIVCFFFFFIRRFSLYLLTFSFEFDSPIWVLYSNGSIVLFVSLVRRNTVLKWDSKCKPIHTYLNQNMMCFKDTNDIFCWVRVSVFDDYTALFYDT